MAIYMAFICMAWTSLQRIATAPHLQRYASRTDDSLATSAKEWTSGRGLRILLGNSLMSRTTLPNLLPSNRALLSKRNRRDFWDARVCRSPTKTGAGGHGPYSYLSRAGFGGDEAGRLQMGRWIRFSTDRKSTRLN